MMRRMLCFAILAAPLVASSVDAQRPRPRPGVVRPDRRALDQAPDGSNAGRLQLEQQIRRSFWKVAKQRIGFNDEQMTRLEQVTQRFDQRRRALGQQEKEQRLVLRREILADTAANQAAVGAALDQVLLLQRQRTELQGEEQKEFASFMTPLQRAKYLGLQDQLRKRVQELVRARPDSLRASPPGQAP